MRIPSRPVILSALVCGAALTIQAASAGDPEPFSHWRLDETSGTLAFEDMIGYYGTYLGGPTLGLPGSVDPCNNTAVGFDGSDDRVFMAGFGDSLDMGTDSFSVVVRFRKTTVSTRLMKLVNKGLTQAGTPENAGYALRVRDGTIEFATSDGSSINYAVADEPAVNAWHFVAGVLDRGAGEARLYLDPADTSPAASLALPALGSLDTNIDFAIAALDRTPIDVVSEHFEGQIDDVRLYRVALTGEQILALHEEQPCLADLAAPAGILDLADVLAFVTAFQAGGGEADLAAPCGLFDLDDVNAFVTVFIDGCR